MADFSFPTTLATVFSGGDFWIDIWFVVVVLRSRSDVDLVRSDANLVIRKEIWEVVEEVVGRAGSGDVIDRDDDRIATSH